MTLWLLLTKDYGYCVVIPIVSFSNHREVKRSIKICVVTTDWDGPPLLLYLSNTPLITTKIQVYFHFSSNGTLKFAFCQTPWQTNRTLSLLSYIIISRQRILSLRVLWPTQPCRLPEKRSLATLYLTFTYLCNIWPHSILLSKDFCASHPQGFVYVRKSSTLPYLTNLPFQVGCI